MEVEGETSNGVSLEEALRQIGGVRNPKAIAVVVACGFNWCFGAMAALIPVFSHDVEFRAGKTTVSNEWDLGTTSRLWMHDFLQTCFWIGFTVGIYGASMLSDKYGRRTTLLGANIFGVISMAASALAPNYVLYLISRVLVGIAFGGGGLVAYVLVTEWCPTSGTRAFLGTIGLNLFYIFGEVFMVAFSSVDTWNIAMTWWRGLTLFIAILSALFLIPSILHCSESPRWLLARERRAKMWVRVSESETEALIASAASSYGVSPPKLNGDETDDPPEIADDGQVLGYAALFSTPRARTLTFAIAYLWFAVSFSYFGINQSAAALVPPTINVYVSVACLALVEIPGNFIAYYGSEWEKLGRKLTCVVTVAIAGVSCVLAGLFSIEENSPASAVMIPLMGLLGKLGVTATFSAMYVLSGESYPTNMRSSGLGLASMVARVGSMISPVFGFSVPASVSLLVWGSALGVASFVTLRFIHETKAHMHVEVHVAGGVPSTTSSPLHGVEFAPLRQDSVELTETHSALHRVPSSDLDEEEETAY